MITRMAMRVFVAVETSAAISTSTVETFTPREHSMRSFWRFTCLLAVSCNKSCATNSAITPSAIDVRVAVTTAALIAVTTDVTA